MNSLAKEIAERIGYLVYPDYGFANYGRDQLLLDAAALIDSALPKWVACSEQLPEFQHKSIIFLAEGWIGCGARSEVAGRWFWAVEDTDGLSPFNAEQVTHWTPLPAAPSTDEKEGSRG